MIIMDRQSGNQVQLTEGYPSKNELSIRVFFKLIILIRCLSNKYLTHLLLQKQQKNNSDNFSRKIIDQI